MLALICSTRLVAIGYDTRHTPIRYAAKHTTDKAKHTTDKAKHTTDTTKYTTDTAKHTTDTAKCTTDSTAQQK